MLNPKSLKKIDYELRDLSVRLSNDGKYKEAIKLNQKVIEDSKQLDYQEGIIRGVLQPR